MIRATGRPQRLYRGTLTGTADGLLLRLDDDEDAEFWLEVFIDNHELDRTAVERLVILMQQRGVVWPADVR